ncbi:MAG TPA: DUF6616 family protein [Balneolaceae bacterium]|nr:DUF6616 family protein [Balneolaceae bacterium]
MQLYVELWNAKQPWLDLSPEERQTYFDMVGEEIGKLTDAGIDLVVFLSMMKTLLIVATTAILPFGKCRQLTT